MFPNRAAEFLLFPVSCHKLLQRFPRHAIAAAGTVSPGVQPFEGPSRRAPLLGLARGIENPAQGTQLGLQFALPNTLFECRIALDFDIKIQAPAAGVLGRAGTRHASCQHRRGSLTLFLG